MASLPSRKNIISLTEHMRQENIMSLSLNLIFKYLKSPPTISVTDGLMFQSILSAYCRQCEEPEKSAIYIRILNLLVLSHQSQVLLDSDCEEEGAVSQDSDSEGEDMLQVIKDIYHELLQLKRQCSLEAESCLELLNRLITEAQCQVILSHLKFKGLDSALHQWEIFYSNGPLPHHIKELSSQLRYVLTLVSVTDDDPLPSDTQPQLYLHLFMNQHTLKGLCRKIRNFASVCVRELNMKTAFYELNMKTALSMKPQEPMDFGESSPSHSNTAVTDDTRNVPPRSNAAVTDGTSNVPSRSSAAVKSNMPSRSDTERNVLSRSNTAVTDGTSNVPSRSNTAVTDGVTSRSNTAVKNNVPSRSDTITDGTSKVSRSNTAVTHGVPSRSDTPVSDDTSNVPSRSNTAVTNGVPLGSDTAITDGVPSRSNTPVTDGTSNAPSRSSAAVTDGVSSRSNTAVTSGVSSRSDTAIADGMSSTSSSAVTSGVPSRSDTAIADGMSSRSSSAVTSDDEWSEEREQSEEDRSNQGSVDDFTQNSRTRMTARKHVRPTKKKRLMQYHFIEENGVAKQQKFHQYNIKEVNGKTKSQSEDKIRSNFAKHGISEEIASSSKRAGILNGKSSSPPNKKWSPYKRTTRSKKVYFVDTMSSNDDDEDDVDDGAVEKNMASTFNKNSSSKDIRTISHPSHKHNLRQASSGSDTSASHRNLSPRIYVTKYGVNKEITSKRTGILNGNSSSLSNKRWSPYKRTTRSKKVNFVDVTSTNNEDDDDGDNDDNGNGNEGGDGDNKTDADPKKDSSDSDDTTTCDVDGPCLSPLRGNKPRLLNSPSILSAARNPTPSPSPRKRRSTVYDFSDESDNMFTPPSKLPARLPNRRLLPVSPVSPGISAQSAGRRNRFTQQETEYLQAGITRFGWGKWKEILQSYPFAKSRSSTSLKDKARNLVGR